MKCYFLSPFDYLHIGYTLPMHHPNLPSPTFAITARLSHPSPHPWCLPHFTHPPPTTHAHNRPTARSALFPLTSAKVTPTLVILYGHTCQIIINQGMKSLLITQHNHPTARSLHFP